MIAFLKILIIPAVFLIISNTLMQAQELNIMLKDGSNERFNIPSIRNITYPNDQMFIMMDDEKSVAIPLSIIQKIVYANIPVNIKTSSNQPSALLLYPNPASTFLHVQLPEMASEEALLEIMGRDGQQVYEERICLKPNHPTITWVIPDEVAPGVYVCRLKSSELHAASMFIIQR